MDVLARPGPVLSGSNRVLTARRILRCTTAKSSHLTQFVPVEGTAVHPKFIAAIVKDGRRSCPCCAVTGRLHQSCHKCLARMIWRRQISQCSRSVIRRQANRLVQASAWTLAAAIPMLRVIGKGARG